MSMLEDVMGQPQEGMEAEKSGVERETPDLPEPESQYVTKWQSKIRAAKDHFKDDFKRMRNDMMIARQGASDDWVNNDNFTVPIINRYLNQSVASLYAKNPTATAERRKTLDFQIWDGKPETAMAALEAAQLGDPNAMVLLMDIDQGRKKKEMAAKIGRTLEVLFDYYANEQRPRLKPLMKALVRRAKTCGVAYIMLGFQRQFAQLSPDDSAKLEDYRNQMGELQRRMEDYTDGEISPDKQNEIYEIENLIKQFENQENKLLREGLLFMYPRSTEIIVDPRCKELMGFIGAGWIVREFHKSPDEVQKLYNVDVSAGYTPHVDNGKAEMADYHRRSESEIDSDGNETQGTIKKSGMVCVWEVYNKELNEVFTIADGYKGFLKRPSEPEYWMEGFWPVFAITFNASENEDKLYPLSDVHQLKHTQAEYNRSREYRRMHREANKPKYVVMKGRMSKEDREKLASHEAHAVMELDGIQVGEEVGKMIQRFQSVPIDPALYETNSEMEDVLRTVGAQEATMGSSSGGTATESSIAESGRMTNLSSNVDDLDEFLSDVVSAAGQLMMMELSQETVMEIAGPGAVWPEMNREQIAKEVILKVKAGSAGKPNKAAELANMERGMPYLLQLPGMNPYSLGKKYADLLEIDLEDLIVEGLPSITALNAQMGRNPTEGVGGPNDPNNQGAQGATNAPSTVANEAGPQPAYTPAMI